MFNVIKWTGRLYRIVLIIYIYAMYMHTRTTLSRWPVLALLATALDLANHSSSNKDFLDLLPFSFNFFICFFIRLSHFFCSYVFEKN